MLLLGIIIFYAITFIRIIISYVNTRVNYYDFAESKDKGFIFLFTVSCINLFLRTSIKYFGDLAPYIENLKFFQLIGLILMIISIILLVFSQNSLGNYWKIGLEEENKTKLIKTGMYRFCRHPIFLAMILFYLSIFLLLPSILTLIILIANLISLIITAKKEEKYLIKKFGKEYLEYKEKVGFMLYKL